MNISSFPQNNNVLEIGADGKPTGRLSSNWYNALITLNNLLQKNLSDEGYILPQADDAAILRLNTARSQGAMIYNTTTKQGMICLVDTFKTITTS